MDEVVIRIDLGKYKYIDLDLDSALKFVNEAIKVHGATLDLEETLRYLRNFDEFYSYMQRKFKDFITPPKSSRELVSGKVFIHRLKLYVKDHVRRTVLVIDRRVDVDTVKNILYKLGYSHISIERELF